MLASLAKIKPSGVCIFREYAEKKNFKARPRILKICRAVARLENETRQVSSAEGASRWGIWGHAPQKILKSRGSEMLL